MKRGARGYRLKAREGGVARIGIERLPERRRRACRWRADTASATAPTRGAMTFFIFPSMWSQPILTLADGKVQIRWIRHRTNIFALCCPKRLLGEPVGGRTACLSGLRIAGGGTRTPDTRIMIPLL